LYTNIDQTLVNSLHLTMAGNYCIQTLTRRLWIHYTWQWLGTIVYKHWPDACEFITLDNGWELLYTNIDQTLVNSLHLTMAGNYCIQTLTRHSWIHYTDCWILE